MILHEIVPRRKQLPSPAQAGISVEEHAAAEEDDVVGSMADV